MSASGAVPSIDQWVREVRDSSGERPSGMLLVHNGVVRPSSRDGRPVLGLELTVDRKAERQAVERAQQLPGVAAVRVWINEGTLSVGDDIMLALVAGDIRENVFAALQSLVAELKSVVVSERELI